MSFFNYKVVKSWIDNGNVYVLLDNGNEAFLPISRFKLLANATTEQLQNIEIIDGYALYWPELDEDLSVEVFFENNSNATSFQVTDIILHE